MQKLSVVLVTLNEEKNIDRCLGSVGWADEIVVVDSFSRDGTVELARKYTGRVYQHDYTGYVRQVEQAIAYATGDWVLILDADEEVTAELAAEIRQVLDCAGEAVAYEFVRKPSAFGKWIEHGGWFPDWQLRLFRKDNYYPEDREVHGGFNTKGKRGRLTGQVLHHTYGTIHSYVEKMNDYTSLEVSNRLSGGPIAEVRWYNLILSPVSHFLRMFLSKKGYKDGFHGFVLALLDATYSMLLYAKIWEYQMRRKEGKGMLPPITNVELTSSKRSP